MDVAAIDPAPQFAAACRAGTPGADVREGEAEALPWADGEFDAALCQLVVGFMRDPERGVAEMVRVTRPGGTVAACMWDIAAGGMTMLHTFWTAVQRVDPTAAGEKPMPGTSEGDIAKRFARAGTEDVRDGIWVRATTRTSTTSREPFTFAVGPAGQYLSTLSEERRATVRRGVSRGAA